MKRMIRAVRREDDNVFKRFGKQERLTTALTDLWRLFHLQRTRCEKNLDCWACTDSFTQQRLCAEHRGQGVAWF